MLAFGKYGDCRRYEKGMISMRTLMPLNILLPDSSLLSKRREQMYIDIIYTNPNSESLGKIFLLFIKQKNKKKMEKEKIDGKSIKP